jgi:hypothetical protein
MPQNCQEFRFKGLGTYPNHPFWINQEHVYVLSVEPYPEAKFFDTNQLGLTTFDRVSGQQIDQTLFPVDLPGPAYGRISSVAVGWAPSGHFLTTYLYRVHGDAEPTVKLVLGQVTSGNMQEIPFPWDSTHGISGIAWDGEAFVVHAYEAYGNKTQAARFTTDGTVVLAPASIGPVGPVTLGDYEFRTSSETGDSWYVGKTFGVLLLTGNHRDGSPFPASPTGDFLSIAPPPSNFCDSGIAHPSIAPTADGALVAWAAEFGFCTQKVGLDLLPTGPLQFVHAPTVMDGNSSFIAHTDATTTQPWQQAFWVGVSGLRGIDSVLTDGQSVLSQETLVSFGPGQCDKTHSCEKYGGIHGGDMRFLDSLVWQDELWMGYLDYTSQEKPSPFPSYRILRVAPGCMYPSMYDVTSP